MSGRSTPLSSSKINLHETVIGKFFQLTMMHKTKQFSFLQTKFKRCTLIRHLTMMNLASNLTTSSAFYRGTNLIGGVAN